jgi:hypothetical protein
MRYEQLKPKAQIKQEEKKREKKYRQQPNPLRLVSITF